MSGIVGIVHRDDEPVDRALLRRMTAFMSYCGPDAQTVWLDGRVGLGNALLRADPDGEVEQQPCSLDGQVWITADARIDDQAELIRKLREPGREVASGATDAELVLHAYDAWGERCVEHLIGDFAFAIWDAPRQSLFCARDQFGVVPLYYGHIGNGVVVGNVLKCLRLHPAISDDLNERAVGDFLLFRTNMDVASTVFADIAAVPPAHTLTWTDGALRIRRYWRLSEGRGRLHRGGPQEYVERFRSAFDAAVGDRLRSERAGSHLSGGMDSTSIAVTAHGLLKARGRPFDLRGYTIVYEDLVAEEEGGYAEVVAAAIDIPVERLVAEEYVTRVPETAPEWTFPEPVTVPNQIAEYEITRRIATFSRAMLVGFGGDPLFRSPSMLTPSRWGELARSCWDTLRRDGRLPPIGLRAALRKRRRGGGVRPAVPDWLDRDFARRTGLADRLREVTLEQRSATGLATLLSPFWVKLFASGHPGAHGLPVRTLFPFFDLRVVRCVAETPPIPWRSDKRLLREAMRGRLPDAVRERGKTPLYVPSGETDLADPAYRLAMRPATKRWRRELVGLPAMARYVDPERARASIDSPTPAREWPSLHGCFPLAHWLPSAQQRPGNGGRDEEEVSLVRSSNAP